MKLKSGGFPKGLNKFKLKVKGNSLNEGLVGYWTMDNVSGSDLIADKGNNGTIHGATQVDGKVGKALSFDGVDDYVDCGKDSSFEFNESITICQWIKPNNISRDLGLITKGDAWTLRTSTSGVKFSYGDIDNNWNGYSITGQISTDWQQVALTYIFGNSSSAKIYINGNYAKQKKYVAAFLQHLDEYEAKEE